MVHLYTFLIVLIAYIIMWFVARDIFKFVKIRKVDGKTIVFSKILLNLSVALWYLYGIWGCYSLYLYLYLYLFDK